MIRVFTATRVPCTTLSAAPRRAPAPPATALMFSLINSTPLRPRAAYFTAAAE